MKTKTCWDVYVEITRCFNNVISIQRQFAGNTFAVSEQKAINNVRFRIDGIAPNFYGDSCGDDWRDRTYIAVPHNTEVELFATKDLEREYNHG